MARQTPATRFQTKLTGRFQRSWGGVAGHRGMDAPAPVCDNVPSGPDFGSQDSQGFGFVRQLPNTRVPNCPREAAIDLEQLSK